MFDAEPPSMVAPAPVTATAQGIIHFPPTPPSALATMTWSELWTCEDVATEIGDENALRDVAAEMARRRTSN